jgi:hypothetical protein
MASVPPNGGNGFPRTWDWEVDGPRFVGRYVEIRQAETKDQ